MVRKSDNDSAFKKFLDQNKSLKFLLPLLVVLIVVVIIVNLGSGKDKEVVAENPPGVNDQIDINQPQVDVLPQIIRSDSSEKVDVKKDPFSEPMRLVGVVYSESRSTAIIKWGNYSFIVEKEDFIGDSRWKVVEIKKDKITLESDAERIDLTLGG
jgi:hypothetical protein